MGRSFDLAQVDEAQACKDGEVRCEACCVAPPGLKFDEIEDGAEGALSIGPVEREVGGEIEKLAMGLEVCCNVFAFFGWALAEV